MKFILFIILGLGLSANPISKDCMLKGKKLLGRVKIVTHAADFRVMVRDNAPDLYVWLTHGSLRNCAEWQFVETGENFRIQYVEHAPDFTIKFTQSYSGVP